MQVEDLGWRGDLGPLGGPRARLLEERFYLGRREFDPVCIGYQLTAAAPADNLDLRCLGDKTDSNSGEFEGGFRLDTAVRGNRNSGHEFNDGTHAD
jgi:hypothetical protein